MPFPNLLKTLAPAKALAIAMSAMLAALAAPAQAAPAGCVGDSSGDSWIWVEVTGVKNASGYITLTLYDDNPRKFLVSKGSRDVERVPAQKGTFRTCLKLPSNGVWVIAVYHDEDKSRKINRSGLGIPTEGFGFTNNPSTIAGLPTFRSVRLNVSKPGLVTRIEMTYP